MADQFVGVHDITDSGFKKVDVSELTVNAQTVERQRIVNADDSDAAGLARVKNTDPASTDYGLVVRQVNPEQGDSSVGVPGPMVMGIVSDTRSAMTPDTVQALSITTDGRLRVASSSSYSDMDQFGDDARAFDMTDPAQCQQAGMDAIRSVFP